ncbi:chitin synthase-domain-containing protein [Yarrowia lipolytica]|uniref:chitin synthase n=2 Tax=Yarrowia lipolytica TaxID=4952 RepID=Q6C504_YARLI|nr:YALI0E22198p [Yarrowia lipolytica CLIB122]RDW28261.1 chitin synthase-domain-containing protein [Yarrowia lipolytica]RDW35453.1 chitin synthase-domain-containing protein [Yarrowia lipolytica]RDW38366.1 chitin synthase-domain-containing protein [Yarrowia lipolytica]RDW49090.1 chitin synthase-domain-containing protein [Yarrowia lipolytica]RDW56020.1 chitin synthase-domain-containing protein [Yarrowia lipolytica]|eukprot:XP_504258.1 YALI0E22198p [Yarrowia lipolytica CLIB122]
MNVPPLSSAAVPISTSALLGTLHQQYNSADRSLRIDSTSVLVLDGHIDIDFLNSVWEHAWKRSEDQSIFIGSSIPSAPSSFLACLQEFPNIPPQTATALNVLEPFLTAQTPENVDTLLHNGLSVCVSLDADGNVCKTRIMLSDLPLSSVKMLTHLPHEKDNRAFTVFYNLLLAATDSEIDHLSLKPADEYNLLKPSGTFTLPEYMQHTDDHALATDWRDSLKQCGIRGQNLRSILSTLSGLLLLGQGNEFDKLEGTALIGVSPDTLEQHSTDEVIASTYVALIKTVVGLLNQFLEGMDMAPVGDSGSPEDDIVALVNIVECGPSERSVILRSVFDDSVGISKELVDEGFRVVKTPQNVTKVLSTWNSEKIHNLQQMQRLLIPNFRFFLDENLSVLARDDFAEHILDVTSLLTTSRIWNIINVAVNTTAKGEILEKWTGATVSLQVRNWALVEWIRKRSGRDYTADFAFDELADRYATLHFPSDYMILQGWVADTFGWGPADFAVGQHRAWLSEPAWNHLEEAIGQGMGGHGYDQHQASYMDQMGGHGMNMPNIVNPAMANMGNYGGGLTEREMHTHEADLHPAEPNITTMVPDGGLPGGPYGSDDPDYPHPSYENQGLMDPSKYRDAQEFGIDPEYLVGTTDTVVVKTSGYRRMWVAFVWLLTFWIPSPLLKWIGRMKRPDVRMAWREKLVIFAFIFLINAGIVFYMIFLQRIICSNFDKAWNVKELHTHQGENDYYVGIRGSVYDMTKFYRQQHSDNGMKTNPDDMMYFAGQDLTDYFPPPLTVACQGLVEDEDVWMRYNNTVNMIPQAIHYSGSWKVPAEGQALHQYTWYNDKFGPKIKQYYKGDLVVAKKDVEKQGTQQQRMWIMMGDQIFDFTNYFYTLTINDPSLSPLYKKYDFLAPEVKDMIQNNAGTDVKDLWKDLDLPDADKMTHMSCFNNAFYHGKLDFRDSARCQAANYILLAMACLLSSVTVIKFVSAVRFGSSRQPSMQDKFVVCQVPAYTEDEDALRAAIDSLTCLKYDNRRKLLFVICDGMIVGNGNDKTTPQIVLDIFGVDPKVNPPALAFHSVGEGSQQLNYGKVYSGLYEFEGNIAPYVVVVKVGKESETSKPGNRGKRDSQVMLMKFFNKVHYQAPMSPLELEIFRHINNIIGVDPELYEYIMMVDADTSVSEDSLNRMVSCCADDSRIAGICGETSLQNEQKSWTTMIQVYEYYISHHLAKAFESLFGSVTCLPGCFCMYRLRTADRGRPLIISNDVIREYAENNVDTLHKKNLFSLGEDRYLTTLMSKYFPKMRYKFTPDAHAQTAAPESIAILLSQRRRWINSTVHNLMELLRLSHLCGFCFFGMRFVVFIDLIGTLMLPSVCIYLVYLIYLLASHTGAIPIISLAMIGGVYGLQALIFIINRKWEHVGWMIIYVAAYPIHSFLLPIYAFWNMDNFSWGNTRVVVGEKGGKQLVSVADAGFDPASVPLETWSDYAHRVGVPGAERRIVLNSRYGMKRSEIYRNDDEYEEYMDEFGYDMQTFADEQARFNHEPEKAYHSRTTSLMSGFGGDFDEGSVMPAQSTHTGRKARPKSVISHYAMYPSVGNRGSYYDPMADKRKTMTRSTSTPMSLMSGRSSVMLGHERSRSLGDALGADLDDHQKLTISNAVKETLAAANLDTVTRRQLREAVEDRMGVTFSAERAGYVDTVIDEELERMEE